MTRPLIGVSGSHMVDDHGTFAGYHRSYVNDDYIRSVNEAGGVAILVPFTEDEEATKEIMSRVDGLVLSGGHDVYPLLYGEEPCRQIGPVWPARDKFDLLLLKEAERRGIPVMGICRGCQIINVGHGGTLYQDLSLDKDSYVKHSQNQDPATPTHTIEIQEGSRAAQILGRTEWVTNTHHHQTVHKVGQGLVVTARAKDGTVEILEGTGTHYLMGYQFHPEMMSINNDLAKAIFQDFIAAAAVERD
ncbi:gamma-glutamyl-gamma-aminobutyrate hydrolase family protein [Acidaminococcus timonensis]|uniref:gamma-glutamyl-gamma-aminobutyrate hydrolase family protein n=1 Tax=Acidaminococcus timonensis TaxID=1871002 RepID=UPI0025FBAB01|nr:gamma-glutamyl-gamma-aminobutyrate hydrolase family protein [Acidaminococcus timonensis]